MLHVLEVTSNAEILMSRRLSVIKTFIKNYKLPRCETKSTYQGKKLERGSTWLIFTMVIGSEAYSTALWGMLTC